ncbi:matrix protein [Lyssavirus rabies]|uniref:Matrix protein n=3 Tax=Rabies virus TaxID=11292 RepID=MATRX_RABVE|nr:RecName: Full=Matrix protein; AltName: Full=Phosphoprotein M2 [Rabies virus ERA]AAA47214.1 matrix protein [Lyssavirus rabies]ABN11358.1 matrix protein [Lyssavirus rabies]ABW97211.1 MP [Lyssavirus rabies]ACR15153.1 M [Lyssavirus rabies] [Lyssavirus rabies]AGT98665.1 matrix protein [Lyssavirus rabies]
MNFLRKIVKNCRDEDTQKPSPVSAPLDDDDLWLPPPEYVPLKELTSKKNMRNFCINGGVKVCSPNGYSFRILRHILKSFDEIYSGNHRMIGLVKVVIGLALSGSPVPEGMNWVYKLRRTFIFQWADSRGPLEGEELEYSQEITWDDDTEFVGLQIRVIAKQCHIQGRIWCINMNPRACQLWSDMSLQTQRSEEDKDSSLLLE